MKPLARLKQLLGTYSAPLVTTVLLLPTHPAYAGVLTKPFCSGYNYLQNDIAMVGGCVMMAGTLWGMATGEGDPKQKTKLAVGGLGVGGLVAGPSLLPLVGISWCAGSI